MNRIETHFPRAAKEGRKSLVLYLTAGFPRLDASEPLIEALEAGGADVLELGVPFSDPIADGPTIQAASSVALEEGVTVEKVLALVERVRKTSEIPIILFGAFNPFLHFGLEAVVKRAAEVGADGFIVPDLPLEESEIFEEVCRRSDLSFIHLVAPTTPVDRMKIIARHSSGFVYYVSLKGVTGVAIDISPQLRDHLATLRRQAAPLPVAVGFGIQTPEHAGQIAPLCDAVVVGSSLIRLIDKHKEKRDLAERAAAFARALKSAL